MTHVVTFGSVVASNRVVGRSNLEWSRGVEARNLLSPRSGEADFVLDNSDLEFNDSADPPVPGSEVVIEAETLTQFVGRLTLPQHSGVEFIETLVMHASGTLSLLTRHGRLSSALYQNIRTDEAMNIILDISGVPIAKRDLDIGSETLRWWCLDGNPMEALLEIWHTEGPYSMVYEDKNGIICFRNRNWLTTDTRSTVVQATYGYPPAV